MIPEWSRLATVCNGVCTVDIEKSLNLHKGLGPFVRSLLVLLPPLSTILRGPSSTLHIRDAMTYSDTLAVTVSTGQCLYDVTPAMRILRRRILGTPADPTQNDVPLQGM